ncbi:hypothetical protein [Parafilimonas sp.]|uniref:hypothetical protein n=1 Tax=Parafilimonas sp. TaxID=1969739 RepID=UPI0039E4ABB7
MRLKKQENLYRTHVKEVQLSAEPKSWQPYDTASQTYKPIVYNIQGSLKTGLPGKYKIGIWLPDPANKYDNRYDIKLAPGKTVQHWWSPEGRYAVNILGISNF